MKPSVLFSGSRSFYLCWSLSVSVQHSHVFTCIPWHSWSLASWHLQGRMNPVFGGEGGSVTVQLLWNKTASRSRLIPFFSTSPRPFATAKLRVAIARSERESQRVTVGAKTRDLPRTASETAELVDRDREHRQARTWMKASILPLNSLRLKTERGLDFRILWGLGGRVGGLGTWSGSYDWYK